MSCDPYVSSFGIALLEYSSMTFACPQQPNLHLPLSHLSDGICDCCNGVDEDVGICPDICDEVLKAERETHAKLLKGYELGSNKRNQELFKFKQFRKEKLEEIQQWKTERTSLDPQPSIQQAQEIKVNYTQERKKMAESLVRTSTLLAGMTTSELQTMTVLACQLSGEMGIHTDGGTTCGALRLAGLEGGLLWGEDNYNDKSTMRIVPNPDLAKLIFHNTAEGEYFWTLQEEYQGKTTTNRRRLEEEGMPEDYEDSHDYDDHFGDDDDDDDDDGEDDHTAQDHYKKKRKVNNNNKNNNNMSELEKEFVERVKTMSFSDVRRSFLKRSTELVEEIATALKSSTTDESDEAAEEQATKNTVDREAFNKVKSNLRTKEMTITKGFKSGASALLFFSANEELSLEQLRSLTFYTIYYGKLAAVQTWQAMIAAVDGLKDTDVDSSNAQTCGSPWAGSCPPKTIDRDGTVIPSSVLIKTAEEYCLNQATIAMDACAQVQETDGIPTDIPDGYFGYVTPVAVEEDGDDPIRKMFAPLASFPIEKEAVQKLEEEKERIEQEITALEGKMKDAWKAIGGKDGKKMGPKGELFSLADQCFSVEAGKYTYEVCVFKGAKQKDGDNAGGTSLGKFKRMDYNEETGERTLYWENGQQCWNGPARSATVHITCGAENKILSADEPDTCRYVLQMESYIACDDDYKKRMGL